MQTFDQALMMLFRKDLITYEEALRQSTRPDDFALKVEGIDATDESWVEFEKMAADQAVPEGNKRGEKAKQGDEVDIDRF
jgi:twitching motility protein PilT